MTVKTLYSKAVTMTSYKYLIKSSKINKQISQLFFSKMTDFVIVFYYHTL